MSYFPKEIQVKTELQEKTTEINLSCDHLTTMNFGEPNVAYYRHNTPREKWQCDASVFARPFPIQMPVMGKAKHNLKTFYVPFRVLSPQFNAFISKEPYTPANSGTVIQVLEMPYFTTKTIWQLLEDNEISTVTTGTPDFTINSANRKFTPFGRYVVKILHQLGYALIGAKTGTEHIDAMALLAYAKIYLDFYYSSQYARVTLDFLDVEKLLKKDGEDAYEITSTDIKKIFKVTRRIFYEPDYFVSAWDNPMAPNGAIDIGTIQLQDITINTTPSSTSSFPEGDKILIKNNIDANSNGTPAIQLAAQKTIPASTQSNYSILTQYAVDSLKKMTDYCVRFAMSGVRAVDRYLSRFGVLLSSEKMKRCVYYGEQVTPMNFGAVYATASTTEANVGDYAGNGIINSDNGEHKHFEIESDEYGIIMMISTIIPHIGYFQGIDRNNLHHEVETYFSGIFDQLGTQAVSSAEIYVDNEDFDTGVNGDTVINAVYGYLPRGAEYKTPRDKLTGDFRIPTLNTIGDAWHMFRKFERITDPITHSPELCQMLDAGQYLRIFDNTNEDDGDHFNVIYQFNASARIHAKPLYESYDFESEGKSILMAGIGPKQS